MGLGWIFRTRAISWASTLDPAHAGIVATMAMGIVTSFVLLGLVSITSDLASSSILATQQRMSTIQQPLRLDVETGVPLVVTPSHPHLSNNNETSIAFLAFGFHLQNVWNPKHPLYRRYLGYSTAQSRRIQLQEQPTTIVAVHAHRGQDSEAVY